MLSFLSKRSMLRIDPTSLTINYALTITPKYSTTNISTPQRRNDFATRAIESLHRYELRIQKGVKELNSVANPNVYTYCNDRNLPY
jgi:hypothetical protein